MNAHCGYRTFVVSFRVVWIDEKPRHKLTLFDLANQIGCCAQILIYALLPLQHKNHQASPLAAVYGHGSQDRTYQNHRESGGDDDVTNYRGSDPPDNHTVEVPEFLKVPDLDGQDSVRNPTS